MNQKDFYQQVRLCADPEDFERNNHLLEVIQDVHHQDYLYCIISGFRIVPAFKALDMILYVSKLLNISTVSVIEQIPVYRDEIISVPEIIKEMASALH